MTRRLLSAALVAIALAACACAGCKTTQGGAPIGGY
jgi:hypothetical protein